MSKQPTPKTDKASFFAYAFYGDKQLDVVSTSFARRLEIRKNEILELLRDSERERDVARELARELRDALALALRQWRGLSEMSDDDRNMDSDHDIEAVWFRDCSSILTKAKEALP